MKSMINLKEQALNGKKLAGTMIRLTRNPALAYLAKDAGLDFIMFDCEHSHYNRETIHDTCMTANSIDMPVYIRIPDLSKDYISCFLDAGCSGVMLPMLESADQAEKLVYYSKYPPLGGRGYTTTGAHTLYNTKPLHKQIMEEANSRIMTIGQIETTKGLDNVEEIAKVQGLDMLFIGPNDLSISLGVPGDLLNPIELEAIAKVASACKKNEKLFSMHSGRALEERFAKELDVFMQGTDVDFVLDGMKVVKACIDALAE